MTTTTDTKPVGEENPNTTTSYTVTENIFTVSLWLTLEFALIYLITTVLLFSGLYSTVWSIQIVGLLAIIVITEYSQNYSFLTNNFFKIAFDSYSSGEVWLRSGEERSRSLGSNPIDCMVYTFDYLYSSYSVQRKGYNFCKILFYN